MRVHLQHACKGLIHSWATYIFEQGTDQMHSLCTKPRVPIKHVWASMNPVVLLSDTVTSYVELNARSCPQQASGFMDAHTYALCMCTTKHFRAAMPGLPHTALVLVHFPSVWLVGLLTSVGCCAFSCVCVMHACCHAPCRIQWT